MADIVSPEVRSRMMSGIRGKNTRPELLVRSELHRHGFRFRLHQRKLPGKPDIVLPKYRTVLLVHGCFWHGHDCHLFRLPSTRQDFWSQKIRRNREVDSRACSDLRDLGWRVLVIRECALKGRSRLPLDMVMSRAVSFLTSSRLSGEIRGNDAGITGATGGHDGGRGRKKPVRKATRAKR